MAGKIIDSPSPLRGPVFHHPNLPLIVHLAGDFSSRCRQKTTSWRRWIPRRLAYRGAPRRPVAVPWNTSYPGSHDSLTIPGSRHSPCPKKATYSPYLRYLDPGARTPLPCSCALARLTEIGDSRCLHSNAFQRLHTDIRREAPVATWGYPQDNSFFSLFFFRLQHSFASFL